LFEVPYKGNWKLAYDNSGDGYHVIYSHQSLIETENRFKDEDTAKGMFYYQHEPDKLPMYIQYRGNGHHFKDKRPALDDVLAVFGRSSRFIRGWSMSRKSSVAGSANGRSRFSIWRAPNQ
jgi:phenylpropionate dioxygenase-like ring-hydroxylating dioxygenase large terminal subunit